MKYILSFILSLFYGILCYSQTKEDLNRISSGQWAFDVNPNLFVLHYQMDFFLSKDEHKKVSIPELLKRENTDLKENSYKKFKYDGEDYLVTRKDIKSDPRIFKILKENETFFILCAEKRSLCDCKAETFTYFKPTNQLQRIQKPFSLSLKNNLLDRLKELSADTSTTENSSFCQILETIQ
ncbi:hypothetical protein ASG01_00780 [Chryseobacterium sp. Leaf180]|uniref:hypothetical protein n=1 Tax=Chryseobacterium sp. Leaf180 TaxID=1736289 RepID=UPI000701B436|nr:hypothetical protein [Chryseobacterium sp. Leaf180]KQR94455.1 hypothetical protein ASG01_00780 [Chryseobacterium sp. Leaf180]